MPLAIDEVSAEVAPAERAAAPEARPAPPADATAERRHHRELTERCRQRQERTKAD